MKEEQPPAEVRDIKQEISNTFGMAAPDYHEQAGLRKDIATRLIASLEPWQAIIPSGPIIELGCGTGFVTEGLAELYPNRPLEITDLSPGMVDFNKKQFGSSKNLTFAVRDAEHPPGDERYALTISGFTVHWFTNPALTLGKWLEATRPGGLLLASFPGNESFPEWREHCRELGLPFTANTLPDIEEIIIKMSVGPSQVDYYEDTVTQTFESAFNFFEHIKKIGASTQTEGRSLNPRELSMLIDHWDSSVDGSVDVSYHLVFLAVKRD